MSKYSLRVPLLRMHMEGVVFEFGTMFMEHKAFDYKLFITLVKQPPTLICNNLNRSPSCQTESKSFLKSRKQALTFSLW